MTMMESDVAYEATIPTGYLKGLLNWLKQSNYTVLSYKDLMFRPLIGQESEEFRQWDAHARETGEKGILVQYDMDDRSDINHEIMRHHIDIGLPGNIMIMRELVHDDVVAKEGRLEYSQDYSHDFELYKEFEAMGGVVGYHCNAFERALGDVDRAIEIFKNDIEFFREHMDLNYFSMHGGFYGPDGSCNASLPIEDIVKELDLCWVHNSTKGHSVYFTRSWADGGIAAPDYKNECSDVMPFIAATLPGERTRLLMHPQHYAEPENKVFEIPAIANYKWHKDTEIQVRKPDCDWMAYWGGGIQKVFDEAVEMSALMDNLEAHTPVFINGMSRSGTTLLTSIFDAHPEGSMAYESYPHYLLGNYAGEHISKEDYLHAAELLINLPENEAFKIMKDRGLARLITFAAVSTWTGMTLPEIGKLLRSYIITKQSRIVTRHDALHVIAATGKYKMNMEGGKFWGTKCDGDFDTYFEVFPKSSLVCLLRDGLDILASQMTKGAFNPDAQALGLAWRQSYENSMAFINSGKHEKTAMVKYEELAHDPATVVKALCDKIGIDYDQQMIRQHETETTMTKNPRGQLSAEQVQKPIDTSSIGRWREILDQDDIDAFLRGCGGVEFYKSLGYDLDTPPVYVAGATEPQPDSNVEVAGPVSAEAPTPEPLVEVDSSSGKEDLATPAMDTEETAQPIEADALANLEVPAEPRPHPQLEVGYLWHLKNIMDARRETKSETIDFLLSRTDLRSDKLWVDEYYKPGNPSEMHNLDIPREHVERGVDLIELKRALDAVPLWVKSKTDRITTSDYSFSTLNHEGREIQGITLCSTTFYDDAPVTYRDRGMHDLVKDTFPKPMSVDEYRILNMAQSQFSTLLEEPLEYGMPKPGQIAVDAGAFIGYKAIAFGHAVGPTGKVYAIEIDPFNFKMLQEVIKANSMEDYVIPIMCALSPEDDEEMEVLTRDPGSMGHSLTDFDGFDATEKWTVKTKRLDTLFSELGLDYIDTLHVSVNGYEREVLDGLGDYAHKVGLFSVQAPYAVAGVNLEEIVKDYFVQNGVKVYGKAQAAVVAGPEGKYYNYR